MVDDCNMDECLESEFLAVVVDRTFTSDTSMFYENRDKTGYWYTVDWEKFAVKIILESGPTAKFQHTKNKITRR